MPLLYEKATNQFFCIPHLVIEVTDPVGDVMRFVDQFEENYGPNHPVFYQGSYGQALNDAKQELRFLLVYLHQDNNKNCNNFCRYEKI